MGVPSPFDRLLIKLGHFKKSGAGCCVGILGHELTGCGHLTQIANASPALAIDHCTFNCIDESSLISWRFGGRGGIRTHGTLAGTPVFKTGALNHSATLPSLEIV